MKRSQNLVYASYFISQNVPIRIFWYPLVISGPLENDVEIVIYCQIYQYRSAGFCQNDFQGDFYLHYTKVYGKSSKCKQISAL